MYVCHKLNSLIPQPTDTSFLPSEQRYLLYLVTLLKVMLSLDLPFQDILNASAVSSKICRL